MSIESLKELAPVCREVASELCQPPPTQAACRPQRLLQDGLGIRQALDLRPSREREVLTTGRLACNQTNRLLIEEYPRLRHSDRHNRDSRPRESCRVASLRNLGDASLRALRFRVAVDD